MRCCMNVDYGCVFTLKLSLNLWIAQIERKISGSKECIVNACALKVYLFLKKKKVVLHLAGEGYSRALCASFFGSFVSEWAGVWRNFGGDQFGG